MLRDAWWEHRGWRQCLSQAGSAAHLEVGCVDHIPVARAKEFAPFFPLWQLGAGLQ